MCPELIRPASVNDRVRAKDLASQKLQGLSRRRSGCSALFAFKQQIFCSTLQSTSYIYGCTMLGHAHVFFMLHALTDLQCL